MAENQTDRFGRTNTEKAFIGICGRWHGEAMMNNNPIVAGIIAPTKAMDLTKVSNEVKVAMGKAAAVSNPDLAAAEYEQSPHLFWNNRRVISQEWCNMPGLLGRTFVSLLEDEHVSFRRRAAAMTRSHRQSLVEGANAGSEYCQMEVLRLEMEEAEESTDE